MVDVALSVDVRRPIRCVCVEEGVRRLVGIGVQSSDGGDSGCVIGGRLDCAVWGIASDNLSIALLYEWCTCAGPWLAIAGTLLSLYRN